MNIQGSLNKLELLKNTFSNKKYQSENVIIEVWYDKINVEVSFLASQSLNVFLFLIQNWKLIINRKDIT